LICTQRGRETSAEKKSERQVLEHRKQITGETETKSKERHGKMKRKEKMRQIKERK